MAPLTLAILASVLQMQGADATIASDNKGVDDLLADVRGRLQNQVDPNAPRTFQVAIDYPKTAGYGKMDYHKTYTKWINNTGATSPSSKGNSASPAGRTGGK